MPLKARITALTTDLGYAIARRLEEAGHEIISVATGEAPGCTIRHRRGVQIAEMLSLVELIQPFKIADSRQEELPDDLDLDICLGDKEQLNKWSVCLFVDSIELGRRLRERFEWSGFAVQRVVYGAQPESRIHFGGATPFPRQFLRWILSDMGMPSTESKEWPEADRDIYVYARSPEHEGRRPRDCFDVSIWSDEPETASRLAAEFCARGFRATASADPWGHEIVGQFRLDPGPFDPKHASSEHEDLVHAIDRLMSERGVKVSAHPLKIASRSPRAASRSGTGRDGRDVSEDNLRSRVWLPFAAWQRGELRPYAGPCVERFKVRVVTDDFARGCALAETLERAGFLKPEVSLDEGAAAPGLRLGCPETAFELMASRIKCAIAESGVARGIWADDIFEAVPGDEDDYGIEIQMPFQTAAPGRAEAAVHALCARHEVAVNYEGSASCYNIVANLRTLGFQEITPQSRPRIPRFAVRYGGAPAAVVRSIATMLKAATGATPAMKHDWPDMDMDIYVDVPADMLRRHSTAPSPQPTLFDRRPASSRTADLTFLEPGLTVRIGDLTLATRESEHASLVPSPEEFAGYCIDQPTAETVRHLALSVMLAEPCLLEGPTGTSKTSSIRFLAGLLRQPVVRINLNGQTDTGELVGRYVPAAEDGRSKRVSKAQWRWQDGLLVQAMRNGWWVVLDEVNLAEPQILERINSALEKNPSLVLTEHDNSIIGIGGSPVHSHFRVFATMNPADYAGRCALSPAWRDRWRSYRFIDAPAEAEYAALLRMQVRGASPEVYVSGATWKGANEPAVFPRLQHATGVDAVLTSLARFHVSVEHASASGDDDRARIGAQRKESYVFTRRTLLSVLGYVDHVLACNPGTTLAAAIDAAVNRYYVEKFATPQDRMTVRALLDATGLLTQRAQSAEATEPGDPGPYVEAAE